MHSALSVAGHDDGDEQWTDLGSPKGGGVGDEPYRISSTEHAMICAQGKALAMLANMLHARGQLDAREFAEALGIFGVVVSEDDPMEGHILALWAGAIRESLQPGP